MGSPELAVNVFPFILRGVRLIGIDSAECPMPKRLAAWNYLASVGKLEQLQNTCEETRLEDLEDKIQAMLKGELKRRTLVNLE